MNVKALLDELQKIAATRSVKEWRAASASGDQATAGAIAGGAHQLGLKPRYLKDVSTGGEEAGVDLMMGHRAGPTGESNDGGLLARKLYKPDSLVSQAEFTPQLLQQKQQMTDSARALSPQAKAMVPAMYGHDTMNAGTPLQRSMSFHEYVPGISDLRGKEAPDGTYSRPGAERSADIEGVQKNVLDPMAAKGTTMADTVRRTSGGGNGVNYGNVVSSPQGPKVLDFLPSVSGQANPAIESMKKYAPINGPSKFTGDQANVGALRKEVFKPTMQSNEAPYQDRVMGHMAVGAAPPSPPPGATPPGRVAGWMPAARPTAPGAELATGAASPMARRAASPPAPEASGMRTAPSTPAARTPMRPIAAAVHADPFPTSGTGGFLRGAGTATKSFFNRAAAHI